MFIFNETIKIEEYKMPYKVIKKVLVLTICTVLSACAGLVSKVDHGLPVGSLVAGVIDVVETQRTTLINPHRAFDTISVNHGVREFKGSFCSDLSAGELMTKIEKFCIEKGGEFYKKTCLMPEPVLFVDVRRHERCDYSDKYAIIALENVDAPNKMWLRKLNDQAKLNWHKGMM
jgi:hypothetical protein